MISIRQKGDFSKLSRYFERVREAARLGVLDKYGREGVAALASATPVKTGKTANSWTYDIERQNGSVAIVFRNTNINKGVPMADLIQEASLELMMLADEGFEGSFEKLLESRIRVRMEEIINDQKKEADIEEEMLARVNVLQEVSKSMAEELGREAKLSELAERMKMTEDEVREIMKVTMDALSMSKINQSLQS